jgi:hypothetical protein
VARWTRVVFLFLCLGFAGCNSPTAREAFTATAGSTGVDPGDGEHHVILQLSFDLNGPFLVRSLYDYPDYKLGNFQTKISLLGWAAPVFFGSFSPPESAGPVCLLKALLAPGDDRARVALQEHAFIGCVEPGAPSQIPENYMLFPDHPDFSNFEANRGLQLYHREHLSYSNVRYEFADPNREPFNMIVLYQPERRADIDACLDRPEFGICLRLAPPGIAAKYHNGRRR